MRKTFSEVQWQCLGEFTGEIESSQSREEEEALVVSVLRDDILKECAVKADWVTYVSADTPIFEMEVLTTRKLAAEGLVEAMFEPNRLRVRLTKKGAEYLDTKLREAQR